MAKVIDGNRIQIEKGDTLYGIYGSNWRELSGYTGDPRKLAVGTVLPAPGGSQPAPAPQPEQQSVPASAPTPQPQQANDGQMSIIQPVSNEIAPAQPDNLMQQYQEAASKQLDPAFKEVLDLYKKSVADTNTLYQDLATRTEAREPIVRQIYANLAKELELNQQLEVKQAQQIGEQRIGGAKAAQAAAGIESAQGSFRAPVTAEEDRLQNSITDIAGRYNVKQEDVAVRLKGDIAELYDQAAAYRAQGKEKEVQASLEMVKLVQNHQNEVNDLAAKMYNAKTEAEATEYKRLLDELKYTQEQQRIDLAERRYEAQLAKDSIMLDQAERRLDVSERRASAAEARAGAAESRAIDAQNLALKKDYDRTVANVTTDALAFLEEADVMNVSVPDKLISKQELQKAKDRIIQLSGNDKYVADQVLRNLWSMGNFRAWDFNAKEIGLE